MFCPSCGSMMFPKDGKYVCNSCGATKDIGGKAEVIVTDSKDRMMRVIEDDVATLPKTRILCPECGHTETRIYRCCKCNHSWREY